MVGPYVLVCLLTANGNTIEGMKTSHIQHSVLFFLHVVVLSKVCICFHFGEPINSDFPSTSSSTLSAIYIMWCVDAFFCWAIPSGSVFTQLLSKRFNREREKIIHTKEIP